MATDDTKLVSTEFQVGGKRWKAEFWPKGGEVDDTGTNRCFFFEIHCEMLSKADTNLLIRSNHHKKFDFEGRLYIQKWD